jgi:hypothetical protein
MSAGFILHFTIIPISYILANRAQSFKTDPHQYLLRFTNIFISLFSDLRQSYSIFNYPQTF